MLQANAKLRRTATAVLIVAGIVAFAAAADGIASAVDAVMAATVFGF